MAPKKSVDKTSAATKNTEKKPKQAKKEKVRKEKPKLRTPTVLKIKIQKPPAQPQVASPILSAKPKLSKAENAALRKIEMANEVALAASSKTPVVEDSETVAPVIEPVITPKEAPKGKLKVPTGKKRGRPKKQPKTASALDNTTDITDESERSAPPTKKVKAKAVRLPKKVTVKASKKVNLADKTSIGPRKKKADSTVPGPKNTYKRKKLTEKAQCKCNSAPKRKYTKKGKNAALDDITTCEPHDSPSILEKTPKKNKDTVPSTQPDIKPPGQIDSRKTSMTSVSESLSWTKDISSSSTTTTCVSVHSKDVVRIDKKLPVLRLTDIGRDSNQSAQPAGDPPENLVEETPPEPPAPAVQDTMPSSSSSSSSSSSTSRSSSPDRCSSVNLSSTSSLTISKSNTTHEKYLTDKLESLLKKVDLECITWIGTDNDTNNPKLTKLVDRGLKMLPNENSILTICKNLKSILSCELTHSSCDKGGPIDDANKEASSELDLGNPDSCAGNTTDKSEDNENFLTRNSRYVMLDQNYDGCEDALLQKDPKIMSSDPSFEETFTSDNRVQYTSYDVAHNDDDDVISLFAESVSFMDSARQASAAASLCASEADHEEYIPQMVSKDPIPEFKYCPSRIEMDQNESAQNFKSRAVCEKQNADSTSIYKEPEGNNRTINVPTNGTESPAPSVPPPPPRPQRRQLKLMMTSLYEPLNAVYSATFKGVCFFNLISNCKKYGCIYKHIELSHDEVQTRLKNLNESALVREYMLVRGFPDLRRKYGIHFVKECLSRELTRILVEMSIDFIARAKTSEDDELKVLVAEHVMLHLNKEDLHECDDLLLHRLGPLKLLCDFFMETLAESCNFSRFKQIFIKLAQFIVDNGRRFDLTVVKQILERLCILPFEEQQARTLILMMKNTDEGVFDMMDQLKRYLLSNGARELYAEIADFRDGVLMNQSTTADVYKSPLGSGSQEMNVSLALSDQERYSAPVATQLDSLNKPVCEPIITRTLNGKRPFNLNSNGSEEYRPNKPKWHYRPQHQHFNMNMNSPRFPGPLNRRPMLKRFLDGQFFGPQPKFPRRPGPGLDPY